MAAIYRRLSKIKARSTTPEASFNLGMLMKIRFIAIAFVLLSVSAALAQDYPIRLARPLKAGDEENLSVTAKMSQSMSQAMGDAPAQEQKEEMTIQYDGVEKVEAVDANGKETQASLTVDKFTQTASGTTTDIAPKGTVIGCSIVDKKQTYEIDGKAVEPALAQALDLLMQLSTGAPTDDEIFGTKEAKKKGDSWDINTALAKAALEGSNGGMQFSDLAGKTTVDDVTGDAMKITAHLTGKAKPPLPANLTLDDSALDATFQGTYPLDTAKYQPEDSQQLKLTYSAHADIPFGGKMVVKFVMEQSVERKTTPVK